MLKKAKLLVTAAAIIGLPMAALASPVEISPGSQFYYDDATSLLWDLDFLQYNQTNEGDPEILTPNTPDILDVTNDGFDDVFYWRLATIMDFFDTYTGSFAGYYDANTPPYSAPEYELWFPYPNDLRQGPLILMHLLHAFGFEDYSHVTDVPSSIVGRNTTVHYILVAEVNPIPVPAAAWLFGTALIGLVGFIKRRKAT